MGNGKKGLSEVMLRVVMSLCDGAKTSVRAVSTYLEKFQVQVGVGQGSVLSPLLFPIIVDVITDKARGVFNELLNPDDLVLLSEVMEDIKERFWNWKDALEGKGLKFSIRKIYIMVSGSERELFKSMIDPCEFCGRRVIANLVLSTKCGNWVHGRCAKMKRVT